ncbi:MAG: hypothetical protein HY057_07930 [Rhodospirillales bacterium]|nr:hypothetical protein [Rhodospirillales bacterium]
MIRKVITALFVLASVLIGFSPVGAPTASPMAASMDMQEPCCDICDRQAMPEMGKCQTMAVCVTAPSPVLPDYVAVPVRFFTTAVHPMRRQAALASAGSLPPFRPPRSSLLV